jgi:hypothetical protein
MATVIKLKRSTTASTVPTTGDLADGEVAINVADKKIYVNNAGTITEIANAATAFDNLTVSGNTDLGDATSDTVTVTGRIDSHIVPSANDTYDLGTSDLRWRTAYMSASTLDLGGATISSDGSGALTISATGGVRSSGGVTRDVSFYKTGDLNTANATFNLKATGAGERVFDNFTLASGAAITTQDKTLFSF